MPRTRLWVLLLCLFIASACQSRQPATESARSDPRPAPAGDAFDSWMGRWIGPEGTYLELARSGGRFSVLIHSLDSTVAYQGTAAGDHIEFMRGGMKESVRAGDGNATGMKWLLEKKNCLVVRMGEGFCRD